MLRGLMAVSADGLVCRGPKDDMRWTGEADKAVFREVTRGCVMGAGRGTYEQMPRITSLGRTLLCVTREPRFGLDVTLGAFHRDFPDGWLIGGQTVLLSAIREGLVDRVLMSHVRAELGSGVEDLVTPLLSSLGWRGRSCPQEHLTLVTWRRGE